jgi:hypothetical protein
MRLPAGLLAIIVVLGPGSRHALAECLRYEPATVSLTGKLLRRTSPAPPNSVKTGDRPETYWLLQLDNPVCVAGTAKAGGLEPGETDIREVQLGLPPWMYESHKPLVGKRVVGVGRLTHAISGHHHTAVLLAVNSLEPAP